MRLEGRPHPAPEGACPRCGTGLGAFSTVTRIVECKDCGRGWPESYWKEQAAS